MSQQNVLGIVAEFENPAELLHAAEKMKNEGYIEYDCHSPFPIHGMDEAMGEKRSPLGYIVGTVAIISFISMILFQGWTSAIDYPIVVAGKPYFSYQAFGVPAWAVMVLLSALTAVVGMLIFNRLPRYHHPVFYSDNFSKVTTDGFFMSVEVKDTKFDSVKTKKYLESIGGKNIELLIPND